MFSSDLTSNAKTRRQTAGWGTLNRPLSQPDRDYLENKAGQLQGSYISDDFGRTQHLLSQDDRMTRGARAIRGPATLALSRGGSGGYDDGGGAGPGRIPPSGALNALLADKSQAFQQLGIEDVLLDRADRARDLLRPTAEQDLFTGRIGARERAAGDIGRDEAIRNAEAAGTAEARGYLAPGQADKRRQQTWDQEYAQERLNPYSKEAIRGSSAVEAARARAAGQVGAAEATGASRTGSAALNALQRNAGSIAMDPAQQERIARAEGAISPNVPGQAPAAGGKIFPASKLQSFAQQNGMSPEQAAEYLTRIAGYRIQ